MKMRNWLGLGRKLVDQYDMDATVQWIQQTFGYYTLSYFGFGVQNTANYPNPFPITMAGGSLGGSVGYGIAYNPDGQLIHITPNTVGSPAFGLNAADANLDRWDLLVIRYKQTGDTLIPKPSNPLVNVFLNLHDDFEIDVRQGTPAATPVYPAKTAGDVILAGLRVPAGTMAGTGVVVDLGVRELARGNQASAIVFKQELLTGVANGANTVFTTSLQPLSANSLLVFLDSMALTANDYTVVGQTVTLNTPPAYGQQVSAYYVVNSTSSQNPLAGQQERPAGVVDGVNNTFTLAGAPADQNSTILFVDGRAIPESDWTLTQGSTNKIQITGFAPAPGQDIYVFYFVNPASVGVAPAAGGGGGSGGGAFTVAGSLSSPQLISSAAGVAVTTGQRQFKFVASQGGPETISANPQVQSGSIVGQELILEGTSNTDYLTLVDGQGLSLNGPVNLTRKAMVFFVWDGETWSEVSRR